MKKFILLALATLIMVGCNYTPVDHTTNDGKQVVLIDTCEYIKYSNGYGAHYSHKGNCKYCAQRRHQEMVEFIEQLNSKKHGSAK